MCVCVCVCVRVYVCMCMCSFREKRSFRESSFRELQREKQELDILFFCRGSKKDKRKCAVSNPNGRRLGIVATVSSSRKSPPPNSTSPHSSSSKIPFGSKIFQRHRGERAGVERGESPSGRQVKRRIVALCRSSTCDLDLKQSSLPFFLMLG